MPANATERGRQADRVVRQDPVTGGPLEVATSGARSTPEDVDARGYFAAGELPRPNNRLAEAIRASRPAHGLSAERPSRSGQLQGRTFENMQCFELPRGPRT